MTDTPATAQEQIDARAAELNAFIVHDAPCSATILGTACDGPNPPVGRDGYPLSRCLGCRYNGRHLLLDMMLPIRFEDGAIGRDAAREPIEQLAAGETTQAHIDASEAERQFVNLARDADQVEELTLVAVAYRLDQVPGWAAVCPGDPVPAEYTPDEDLPWFEWWALDPYEETDGVVPPVVAHMDTWTQVGHTRGGFRVRKGDASKVLGELAADVIAAGGTVWLERLTEHRKD